MIINTVNIVPHHHSSPNKSRHPTGPDNTNLLSHLLPEPNIQSPDHSNQHISPLVLTVPVNLLCRMINLHLTLMVSLVLLQAHGSMIPVCSSLHLVDLLLGCRLLDTLSFIIPINRFVAEYPDGLPLRCLSE